MTVQIPFDLPFEECASCYALDPIIKDKSWRMEGKKTIYDRTMTCKGATFCRYLKNNIFIRQGEER